jgi:hypothetical protein
MMKYFAIPLGQTFLEDLLKFFPPPPVTDHIPLPPVQPDQQNKERTEMSIELKIKSKHLGLEAKVIRHEEKKLLKQLRWQNGNGSRDRTMLGTYESIHNHRVWNVRNENRATFLARAFIAGKLYENVEQKVHDKNVLRGLILPRVVAMVATYGPKEKRLKKKYDPELRRSEYNRIEYQKLESELKSWMFQGGNS